MSTGVGLAFALLDMARITQNDDQKREFEMEAQSITRSLLQSGAKHRELNVLRSFFIMNTEYKKTERQEVSIWRVS